MLRTILIKVLAISALILVLLCVAEVCLRLQPFVKLDGFRDEVPWSEVFHHGSGKFAVADYGSGCDGSKIKVLLLGDSWMEDESLSGAIGQEFADRTGKCVQTINGGTNSYSPSLYLLKAKQGFEKYGNFDYIIANIDETDIGDECLRYKIPLERNERGQMISVSYKRDLHSMFIWNGKLWAENSDFYIVRLLKFAFFYKALVPMLYELTFCPDYPSMMTYVFAPDAKSHHQKEHKYFEARLMEMAKALVTFTKDGRSVYVTHHPHLRGLIDRIDSGPLYLPVVSQAIARLVDEESGVTVLDARNHIRQIHGDALLEGSFVEGDPFSHLADEGAVRYGRWIAGQLEFREK